MNNQQALDKAVAGIKKQGALAQIDRGPHVPRLCSYINENGHKCAVGQLLTKATAQRWEKWGTGGVRNIPDGPIAEAGLQNVDMDFLINLQAAHDEARSVEEFLLKAETVATAFELEFNHA